MSRIDGIHINLKTLSNAELLNAVEHAERRLESVWMDLYKYNGEIAMRPMLDQPEPETEGQPIKERYDYE